MGHSFGGALACKLSIKHPQEVKKLFLVSAACVRKKTNKKIFQNYFKNFKIFFFSFLLIFSEKHFINLLLEKVDYVYVEG